MRLTVRKLLFWIMLAVIVLSVTVWFATRDTLPPQIRVATAARGGLYHKFGTILARHLEDQAGRPVVLLETRGSGENRDRLLEGSADLAVLQSGSVPMDGLSAVAPLYEESVLIVARKGSGIVDVGGLEGSRVALGPEGSGMRASALELLSHYRIDASSMVGTERYFLDLLTEPELDAAVISTGLLNPDLGRLLEGGGFDLVPVLDGPAIALRHPYFSARTVPRGLFAERPPVPPVDVPTVGTVSFLAVREDASNLLVGETLAALYDRGLLFDFPALMPVEEVGKRRMVKTHPAARRFHEPYAGIDLLASFMESLAAGKELLFALGAALYLAWTTLRRMRERERAREMARQKEALDAFLEETLRIEEAQMEEEDLGVLKGYLDEVTGIKLRALSELTHEDLRGDRMFLIFLTQCANLIRKIQSKMALEQIAPRK